MPSSHYTTVDSRPAATCIRQSHLAVTPTTSHVSYSSYCPILPRWHESGRWPTEDGAHTEWSIQIPRPSTPRAPPPKIIRADSAVAIIWLLDFRVLPRPKTRLQTRIHRQDFKIISSRVVARGVCARNTNPAHSLTAIITLLTLMIKHRNLTRYSAAQFVVGLSLQTCHQSGLLGPLDLLWRYYIDLPSAFTGLQLTTVIVTGALVCIS